jgi:hypothetical protein
MGPTVRPAASALLAVGVLALMGCGGGDDKPPGEKEAGAAVTAYAHAFGSGDGDKACALLTPDARAAFVKRVSSLVGTTDCAEAMAKLQTFAGPNVTGPFEDATVSDVKVDGDKATASLVAGGHTEEVTLELQSGDWLLTKAPGT